MARKGFVAQIRLPAVKLNHLEKIFVSKVLALLLAKFAPTNVL
jgi:hypothetical protein